jgi:hypothetical protein
MLCNKYAAAAVPIELEDGTEAKHQEGREMSADFMSFGSRNA